MVPTYSTRFRVVWDSRYFHLGLKLINEIQSWNEGVSGGLVSNIFGSQPHDLRPSHKYSTPATHSSLTLILTSYSWSLTHNDNTWRFLTVSGCLFNISIRSPRWSSNHRPSRAVSDGRRQAHAEQLHPSFKNRWWTAWRGVSVLSNQCSSSTRSPCPSTGCRSSMSRVGYMFTAQFMFLL